MSLHLNPSLVSISEKQEFKKFVKQNVFIDSYYPRIFGSSCDECKKRRKKLIKKERNSNLATSQNSDRTKYFLVVDSTESESKETHENNRSQRKCYDRGKRKMQQQHNFEQKYSAHPTANRKRKKRKTRLRKRGNNVRECEVEPLQNSVSTVTRDSKTYTIYSLCTECDIRPLDYNVYDSKLEKFGTSNSKFEQKLKNEIKPKQIKTIKKNFENKTGRGADIFPKIESFSKLHNRIEDAEDLLQKVLGNFSSSRVWKVGSPLINDMTNLNINQNLESSDTELEIWNIKKRLINLERKLRQEERHANENRCHLKLKNLNLKSNKDFGLKSRKKYYSSTEQSNGDSNDTLELNESNDLFLQRETSQIDKEKAKYSVKGNFVNTCKKLKRKCSSIIASSFITKKSSSSRKCFIKEAKRIPQILYEESLITEESVDRTFRCYSFPVQKNINNTSLHKNKDCLTKVIFSKKFHNENILNARSQTKAPQKRATRKPKFTKHLSKKNSETNIFLLRGDGDPNKLIDDSKRDKKKENLNNASIIFNDRLNPKGFLLQDVKTRNIHKDGLLRSDVIKYKTKFCLPQENENSSFDISDEVNVLGNINDSDRWFEALPPSYWTESPLWTPFTPRTFASSYQNCHCSQKKFLKSDIFVKGIKKYPNKKREYFRNPLEILKRGGKINIPVLFEELCRTKKNEILHKASDISMRFVLVEEDFKNESNSLKKLIKKLSNTQSSNGAEQYVFGVTKCCCCDNQV